MARLPSLCAVLLAVASLAAAPADSRPRITALIDQQLASAWGRDTVTPAPISDDAEFLRRVSLDLAGRIPRVADVRAFLDDTRSDKRERLVARLLDSPSYVDRLTAVWREVFIPSGGNPQQAAFAAQLEPWLRRRILQNTGFDVMARQLITAQLNSRAGPAGRPFPVSYDPAEVPTAFLFANEQRPENLAAATSRIFLGVKLECAQCHDHPFAPYTRKQFWEFAAFFASVTPPGAMTNGRPTPLPPADARRLKIPGTDTEVTATFLDGRYPPYKKDFDTRAALADWITSKENPYFAKAVVNRVWESLFGLGLRDPVDDPRDDIAPSHPVLLDQLAREFAAGGFDLKTLVHAIVLSRAYQATSRQTDPSQADTSRFARMQVRGLSAEQLYDSLAIATGDRNSPPTFNRFAVLGNSRNEFLTRFSGVERATETQTSILQALTLMNGKFVTDQTSLDRSEVLAAIHDAPFLDTPGKVEALYLAALGRKPRAKEAERFAAYIDRGGPSGDRGKALADVFWVILNSSEFRLNH